MDLALFDFDGTITCRDTYSEFIKATLSTKRRIVGTICLSPLILCYCLGLISGSTIRSVLSWFAFWKVPESHVVEMGQKYAREFIPSVLRPKAIDRINWHKKRGDRVVLVSASLNVYLNAWCDDFKIDCICSQLEFKNGICTGKYIGRDCTDKEKKVQVLSNYKIQDYGKIYAYGDTAEDYEMLEMAHEKFYRFMPDVPLG